MSRAVCLRLRRPVGRRGAPRGRAGVGHADAEGGHEARPYGPTLSGRAITVRTISGMGRDLPTPGSRRCGACGADWRPRLDRFPSRRHQADGEEVQ